MALLAPGTHRVLDFVTVVIFAIAPLLLGLPLWAAWLSYILAVVHLIMTLATAFPGSGGRPIPLVVHGGVELVVGIGLLILGTLAPWPGPARAFYGVMGVVILVVWLLTEYRGAAVDATTAAPGARERAP